MVSLRSCVTNEHLDVYLQVRSPQKILVCVICCLRPNSSDQTKSYQQVELDPCASMDPLMRLENTLLALGVWQRNVHCQEGPGFPSLWQELYQPTGPYKCAVFCERVAPTWRLVCGATGRESLYLCCQRSTWTLCQCVKFIKRKALPFPLLHYKENW